MCARVMGKSVSVRMGMSMSVSVCCAGEVCVYMCIMGKSVSVRIGMPISASVCVCVCEENNKMTFEIL